MRIAASRAVQWPAAYSLQARCRRTADAAAAGTPRSESTASCGAAARTPREAHPVGDRVSDPPPPQQQRGQRSPHRRRRCESHGSDCRTCSAQPHASYTLGGAARHARQQLAPAARWQGPRDRRQLRLQQVPRRRGTPSQQRAPVAELRLQPLCVLRPAGSVSAPVPLQRSLLLQCAAHCQHPIPPRRALRRHRAH
jgi:hypothetical protein